jgi:acyl carrier protein
VLSGIEEKDWPRIKQIVMEVHGRSLMQSIVTLLEARGFEFVIDDSMVVAGNGDTNGNTNGNGNGNDVYVAMLYAFSQDHSGRRQSMDRTEMTSQSLIVTEVQNFLRRSLPPHFVPSVFMILDALPLTPNGKIDRKALPLPSPQQVRSEVEFVAPQTPTEKELAAIWAEILGSDHIGIHDNFFNSGGHSLSATQLVTHIRKNFYVELSLRDFLKYPTIAGLAELIEESILSKASDARINALLEMLENQSHKEA